MLATSRMASSCDSFKSRTSSMPVSLKECRSVQNKRRRPIGENGRATDVGGQSPRSVKGLDHDVLLTHQGIDHQGGPPLADFQNHGGPTRRCHTGPGGDEIAEMHRWNHLIPD